MPDNARCSFTASFKDLPENTPLRVTWYNSDLGIGYPVEKTIQNGNTITHISNFVTLFTVRHDAETNLWYETGSWEEVRQKTPAVTTYREILHGPVCTRIIDGKKIYKNFRLKDQCRKIKLGRLESNDILQTPAEQ